MESEGEHVVYRSAGWHRIFIYIPRQYGPYEMGFICVDGTIDKNGNVIESPNPTGTFSSDDSSLTSPTTDIASERLWEFFQ